MLKDIVLFLYAQLISDPALTGHFSGSDWLHYGEAFEEPSLPYIVHQVEEGRYNNENHLINGVWRLSIYTYEATTAKNISISSLIKHKFSNQHFYGTKEDNPNFFVPFIEFTIAEGEGFISTGNTRVKRFDLNFYIRYGRNY